VGPRAGLDSVVRKKIPSPYRDSNPPIIKPVAQCYVTELPQLLSSIIRIVKPRRSRWVGHTARMKKTRNVYRILMENVLENGHLEDRIEDEVVTLGCILGADQLLQ
jgi:hypothetical protein